MMDTWFVVKFDNGGMWFLRHKEGEQELTLNRALATRFPDYASADRAAAKRNGTNCAAYAVLAMQLQP